MWTDGGPVDPSPTIDQAIGSGYYCSRTVMIVTISLGFVDLRHKCPGSRVKST